MADKDFEEFSDNLDELPQHFRATDKTYQWVFFWKKREGKVCCWCYARFETFLKSQGNAPRRNWKVSFFVPFNQSSEIDLILGKSSIFVFAVAGQSLLRQKSFQYKNDPAITTKKKTTTSRSNLQAGPCHHTFRREQKLFRKGPIRWKVMWSRRIMESPEKITITSFSFTYFWSEPRRLWRDWLRLWWPSFKLTDLLSYQMVWKE